VASALVGMSRRPIADELRCTLSAAFRYARRRHLRQPARLGLYDRTAGWFRRHRLDVKLIKDGLRMRPVQQLPLKVNRLFSLSVVGEVAKLAAVDVRPASAWTKEEVDRVDAIVVLDQIQDRRMGQALARL